MTIADRLASFVNVAVESLERPAGRRLFWLFVAILFLGMGANVVRRAEIPRRLLVPHPVYRSPVEVGESKDSQAQWRSSEFRAFRKIAWGVVREGIDPYRDIGHLRAYPPFFGIAFYPFAHLWRVTGLGSALFFAVSFVFGLLAVWCASRWVQPDGRGRFGVFAFMFLLFAPMMLNVMGRSESDLILLFPITAAFLWLTQGRKEFSAGVLLGFAASFKVLPGLFGLYLICTRQWRALGGMIAGGIVFTVLLPVIVFGPTRAWELHRSWFDVVVAPYHTGGAKTVVGNPYRPSNQSMTAGLNRLLRELPQKAADGETEADFNDRANYVVSVFSLPPRVVSAIVKVLQLAILLSLIFVWGWTAKRIRSPVGRAAAMALVGPGILLLSEVSLTSHHVYLLLPMAVLIVGVAERQNVRAERLLWGLVLYVLCMALVGFPMVKSFTPLLPVTVALGVACVLLAVREAKRATQDGSQLPRSCCNTGG